MALADKRMTQLDMLALKLSGQTSDRSTPDRTPEGGSVFNSVAAEKNSSAVSNKRVRFEGDRDEAQLWPVKPEQPLQLRAAWEAPWQKYEKIYDLELGGPVAVAVRRARPRYLVHVRAFSTEATPAALHLFCCFQHRHIVAPLEAFTTDAGLHIVLEHMPVSLQRIVDSPAYPDEGQLAAILAQVGFHRFIGGKRTDVGTGCGRP
jgi:hypothetical protein